MFAEPMIGKDRVVEFFFASFNSENQTKIFEPESVGMTDSQWETISRSHFYRKESADLINKLKPLVSNSTNWKLYRVCLSENNVDTVLVFSQNKLLKTN